MALSIVNVNTIFRRLSGLDSTQAEELSFFCESSLATVSSRLIPGTDMSVWGGRIEFAAAAMAYYRFILWSLTDGGGCEIKAGDISIKKAVAAQAQSAETLCRNAFTDLKDIIADDGFVFEGM